MVSRIELNKEGLVKISVGLCRGIILGCKHLGLEAAVNIFSTHGYHLHMDQGKALLFPWALPEEGFAIPMDLKHCGTLRGCTHLKQYTCTQNFIYSSHIHSGILPLPINYLTPDA